MRVVLMRSLQEMTVEDSGGLGVPLDWRIASCVLNGASAFRLDVRLILTKLLHVPLGHRRFTYLPQPNRDGYLTTS